MTSQFDFENEINSLIKLDGPLQGGPLPRWQRRALEKSTSSRNVSSSLNSSQMLNLSKPGTPLNRSLSLSQSYNKTPKSGRNTPGPEIAKTPGGKGEKTPNKSKVFQNKSPSRSCRFIPNRTASNLNAGQYKFQSENTDIATEQYNTLSVQQHTAIVESLNQACPESTNDRIFAFQEKVSSVEGFQNSAKILFSSTKKRKPDHKKVRHIPSAPERVLDAPDLLNDYYLNLIDWSSKNILAVALKGSLYLWDANTGEANMLTQEDDDITSVRFIPDGQYLAIGTSNSEVQLWDVAKGKRLRNMTSHAARVSSLSWNEYILSSGSKDGFIHHHDVRVSDHHVATLSGHTQEVCGLEWSPDLKYLASGANDNLVNIYDDRVNEPLQSHDDHLSAVKALAWCPWQPHTLATGGGSTDRTIKLWNTNNSSLIKSVDTTSQVCALKWSKNHKELISSHGYALNQLTIWSYPSMQPIQDLLGHTARVLFMALSPDGTTVCSGSADETLRLWNCFAVDSTHQKKICYGSKSSTLGDRASRSKFNPTTTIR